MRVRGTCRDGEEVHVSDQGKVTVICSSLKVHVLKEENKTTELLYYPELHGHVYK